MDVNLHYVEKGKGDVLILLHGNGEDGTYFVHQIEHFSHFYRVIAIDTRGHGKSPRGDAPFTIRQFVEDLYCFMGEMKIDKANILGFSDGGNIAALFAIKYPERVKKLILNGANLNAKGVKPLIQIPIEIGYRMASFFSKKSADAKKNAETLGLMVNDPNIDAKELSKIQAKTLVIAGTKDMIKTKHTEYIFACLPDAEIVFIPGNHFIANKKPEEFNVVVEKFLLKG